jgi:hypothetical protein
MTMSTLLDTIGSQSSRALGFWDTNSNVGNDNVAVAIHHTFSAFARLLQKTPLSCMPFSY